MKVNIKETPLPFVGPTEERNIKTSDDKTFKLFMTEQEGGYWVASVLYAKDGSVDGHHESREKPHTM
jgi:hypothetical protein